MRRNVRYARVTDGFSQRCSPVELVEDGKKIPDGGGGQEERRWKTARRGGNGGG
jgi:hypothetical protein